MPVAQAIRSWSGEGVSFGNNRKKGFRETAHLREATWNFRQPRCGGGRRRCVRASRSSSSLLHARKSCSNCSLDGAWVLTGGVLSAKGSEGLKTAWRKGVIG